MKNLKEFFTKMVHVFLEGARGVDATRGSITQKLLIIGIPLMLTFLMNNLYELVDAYFLGRYSESAIASVQISRQIVWFFMSLGIGLGGGGTTLVSQAKGSRRQDEMGKYSGQTMVILMSLSVIVSVIALIFSRQILTVMKTPDSVIDDSVSYIQIILGTSPVLFFTAGLTVLLNGSGNTFIPFLLTATTVVLNVIFDPILIFGVGSIIPAMGVSGAAISTLLCRLVVAVVGSIYVLKGKAGFTFKFSDLKPSWTHIKNILKIGVPGSMGSLGTSFGFVILMSIVSRTAIQFYNGEPTFINGYGIANTFIGLYFTISIGLGQAVGISVGQNLGAGKEDRMVKTVWDGFWIAAILLTTGSLLMIFFGTQMSEFFIPADRVNSVETAIIVQKMLRITSFGVVVCGLTFVLSGAFQGTGKTLYTMVLGLSRLWLIRLPLAEIITFGVSMTLFGKSFVIKPMAGDGIFWAMNISNIITFVITMALFLAGKWKRQAFVGGKDTQTATSEL